MTGLPHLVRLMGYGLRRPKQRVIGQDVAGVVEAVGKDVLDLQPGDEVFGVCRGALAEYACADAEKVVPMPRNLTFEQAAAVPVSGCAALLGLRDEGRLVPGRTVLVIGASGGVGTFAVQLAKEFDAHVTGVCSTSKVGLVESLGANRVIDYTREEFADGVHRYDLILDTAGRRSLSHLRKALMPKGTLVIVGGEGGGRWTGGAGRQLRAAALSPFVRQRLRMLMSQERRADLLVLKDLLEAGRVTPVVDRTYSLHETAEVLSDANEGHGRGRAVIPDLLTPDVSFRGSLGTVRHGDQPFADYVREVTTALGDYRCDVEDLVAENYRVAARMTFSGFHRGDLLGVPPTGRRVSWAGAAFFTFVDGRVAELWVLGDLTALRRQLSHWG